MSAASSKELLVFEVAGHNFAVPLADVEEVVPSNSITKIPNSPHFLLGLSAVRGKVMGVIDAGLRYGLGTALNSYFMVCRVRGNLTAITIDRALFAGELIVRELASDELELARSLSGVDTKFVKGGFEILEKIDDTGATRSTGTRCVCIDPNLFVSAEMASRVGEAV
ncbi:MAG: chemotaxis protein CheW [Bdellovibrionota bacterium]